MFHCASKEAFTFSSLAWNTSSQKSGGPTGQTRRKKPHLVMGGGGGIGILGDVEERLAPVEVQPQGRADILSDLQRSNEILRRAHEDAVIKIPDIEV